MIQVVKHDCATCAYHIVKFEDIQIDPDDTKVYERIQTQLNNAQQAADPSALENLPGNLTQEDKALYLQTAMKNLDDAKALLKEWWEVMMEKYGIPIESKYDSELKIFYRCVDDQGNADLHGQYVPKGSVMTRGSSSTAR